MPDRKSHVLAALLGASAVLVGAVAVSNTGTDQTTVTGTLKVAVAMGDVPLQATVETSTGPVSLDLTDTSQPQVLALVGQEVKATGVEQADGDITATKVKPTTAQQSLPSTPSAVHIAYVIESTVGTTNPTTVAQAQAALDQTLAFLRANSGNRVTFDGQVFGPFVTSNATTDCNISDWTSSGGAHVGSGFNYVAVNSNAQSCAYSGIAYVGSSGVHVVSNSVAVLEHELGHNFGAWHSGLEHCGDGTNACLWDYGDGFDTMGSGSQREYSAFNKYTFGWIHSDQVQSVNSGTVTLTGVEHPDLPGLKMAQVGNGFVEFKDGTDYDAGGGSPAAGVRFYDRTYRSTDDEWIPLAEGLQNGVYVERILPGDTFTTSGGVAIKVVSETDGAGGSAVVQIGSGVPPTTIGPTSTTQPPGTTTTIRPTTTTTTIPGKAVPPVLGAQVQPDGTVKVTWSQPVTVARTALQLLRGPSPTHVNGIGTFYDGLLAQGFTIDTKAPAGTSYYLARFTTAGSATAWSTPVSVTK